MIIAVMNAADPSTTPFSTQKITSKNKHSSLRELIEQEAQGIWCITELLGKIGAEERGKSDHEHHQLADGTHIILSLETLHHFAGEISHRLTHLMEQVDRMTE